MKDYLLQYQDEDGVHWASFSSAKERSNFISFHKSEIYEKFEPLQELEKEQLIDIEDLVIDTESYIKLMKIEGYEASIYYTDKELKFLNLKGVLKKDSCVNFLINRKLGKKKYILDNVVISFMNEENCYIEGIFLKEPEHYNEHKYVVVLDNDHLYVKEDTPIISSISGRSSFGCCLELIQFIRKNIKL